MSLSTVGDMRQFFMTTRQNFAVKTDLNTLVEELTTGQVSDLTAHLGSGQSNLAGLDRTLEMLGRYAEVNADTGQLLSTMQTVMDGVEQNRSEVSAALLTIDSGSDASRIANAAQVAQLNFEATVNALNTRYGGRALFGGNDLEQSPMAPPDALLDDLRTSLAGLTSPVDISVAIDTWFDAPGGGFETVGYLGDPNGKQSRSIDSNLSADIDLRADDPAIRDTLKAFAKGALAGDETLFLSTSTRQTLQRGAGESLLSAASLLAGSQARIGYVEGQVEEASVRISAQQSSYGIARNDLVSADPFETATRLQAVQTQLETQYTLTARLSRLSLTEYLR